MQATIIVRTMNSASIIDQTLKALFSQTYKDFELLIVDSGSSDNTLELVKKYKPRVLHIKPQDYHPGKVLNKAIESSNSKIIVFLNSDTVMLNKYSLENLLKKLKNSDAAFARQVARPEAKMWVRRDYEIAFPEKEAPSWMYFSLPLACFKKTAWEKIKFYTSAWASEDTKWGYDARKEGLKVSYANDSLVMHSHNYTLKQVYNRKFVEGEADVYIFNNKYNLFTFFKNYIKTLLSDIYFCVKKKNFSEIPQSFIVRFVYYLSYYKGHKKGLERLKNKNIKTTYGNYQ